jgi:calcium-dependent protein kinase
MKRQDEKEVLYTLQGLSISKGDFVRENMGFFDDFYKIGKLLGIGTFSEVRKVESTVTNATRAVKVVNKMHLTNVEDIKRFFYEIEILRDLDHPNVLKVFEYFQDKDRLYILTEYVKGGELLTEMNRRKATKQQFFTEEEAAFMIKQVLITLNYLHNRKIVHRDIKPDNILIESMPTDKHPDDPWQIKVVDFGTAMRFKKGSKLTQTFGTSYYVAPEVLDGHYNEKCDIWSAGVVLYMMLSGRPPFTGADD